MITDTDAVAGKPTTSSVGDEVERPGVAPHPPRRDAPRPTCVAFTVDGRPWTLNDERRAVRLRWTDVVRRRAPGLRMNKVHIVCDFKMRHPLPDAGNNYPAVKAAIDGLVDARLIPHDGPKTVLSITMNAPTKCIDGERESMTLTVQGARA
jgi:hypothetical protein